MQGHNEGERHMPVFEMKNFSHMPKWVFIVAAVTIVCLLVVIAGLIGGSFKKVEEDEFCLKYDIYSREVDNRTWGDAGNYFVGLGQDFLCYPKRILSIDFSRSQDTESREPLTCRTLDGLELELDLSVEYRLLPNELFALFTEVSLEFEEIFIRVARSSLRNTASRYTALEYLTSKREQIANQMNADLNQDLLQYHAESIDLQLRQIYLPSAFDDAIRLVEAQQLDAKKAVEEDKVARAKETSKRETAILNADSYREQQIILANANYTNTVLQRQAAIVNQNASRAAQELQAESDRLNILREAESNITVATAERNRVLTEAQTLKAQKIITFQTEVLQSNASAQVQYINANAEAGQIRRFGQSKANATLAALEVERDILQNLSESGMSPEEVMQYMFLEALRSHTKATFYVDYKKVPLFLEGNKGGDIPGVGVKRAVEEKFATMKQDIF